MTRPLGDTAEDAQRWRRACMLAGNDQAGELRERAGDGDEHARQFLAENPHWRQLLAEHPQWQ